MNQQIIRSFLFSLATLSFGHAAGIELTGSVTAEKLAATVKPYVGTCVVQLIDADHGERSRVVCNGEPAASFFIDSEKSRDLSTYVTKFMLHLSPSTYDVHIVASTPDAINIFKSVVIQIREKKSKYEDGQR